MSPKIALILLICSCVVLGLASADRRQHRRRGHPIRRTLPPADEDYTNPEGPQTTDDRGPTNCGFETLVETPSTLKPLAANRKDNKNPKH